jgi:hypothetical protein
MPTRSRPQRAMATLETYMKMANHPEQMGVLVSCDVDDSSMSRNLVHEELQRICKKTAWFRVMMSENKNKIQACNANMNQVDYPWDIVVLVSDDMIPQIQGYDDIIRNHMLSRFPDTDGILWFNDGHQQDKLNTLCIFGRRYYDSVGYIYHPSYKSLFCDTELTDLCRTTLKQKTLYIPYCIIRHEHPGTGFPQTMDELYAKNQAYWTEDMHTYISRKTYDYDWSVLIANIPGREESLRRLLNSLHEKRNRICPSMRMEVCIGFDNKEQSIGQKREGLLQKAQGKYISFVDDDDEVTDAYIEDLWAMIQGGFHTMRLWGQMSEHRFVHSTTVKDTDFMATKTNPPYFQRPPNHLNPMLSDVAKLIHYKNAVYGEDLDWTLQLYRSGFLQTEYRSDDSRTHYIYNMGDRKIHPSTVPMQQGMSFYDMLHMIYTPAGNVVSQTTSGPKPLKLGPKGFVASK